MVLNPPTKYLAMTCSCFQNVKILMSRLGLLGAAHRWWGGRGGGSNKSEQKINKDLTLIMQSKILRFVFLQKRK